MPIYEIPLSPDAQTLEISLGGVDYQLRVLWNSSSLSWVVDFLSIDGTPVVLGIPLVTGANLLEQFDYLNFGGSLTASTYGDINAIPTFENLGIMGHLYFTTT